MGLRSVHAQSFLVDNATIHQFFQHAETFHLRLGIPSLRVQIVACIHKILTAIGIAQAFHDAHLYARFVIQSCIGNRSNAVRNNFFRNRQKFFPCIGNFPAMFLKHGFIDDNARKARILRHGPKSSHRTACIKRTINHGLLHRAVLIQRRRFNELRQLLHLTAFNIFYRCAAINNIRNLLSCHQRTEFS